MSHSAEGDTPIAHCKRRRASCRTMQPIPYSSFSDVSSRTDDPIQPPAVGNTLQIVVAGVLEDEAGSGDEISYGLRDENFGGSGLGRDA
jgi:hypothetical protein